MKSKPAASLGKLGTQFFALMQMREQELLRLGEIQQALGLSATQERDLLSILDKKGFIIRLKRGVYLIPKKIPAGGYWQPSSYYLISQFMSTIETTYYIGGSNAIHYHGLTEQVPNTMTIFNSKLSGKRNIGALTVFFIKVNQKQICELDHFTIPQGNTIYISSLTHTIVDAVKYWRRGVELDIIYNYIKARKNDDKFLRNLVRTTVICGNTGTKRRIGYYLFKITNNKKLVTPLLKALAPTKSWIALSPQKEPRGKTIPVWGVIDNES